MILVDEYAALPALVGRPAAPLVSQPLALTYSRAYRLTRALLDPGPARLATRGQFSRLVEGLSAADQRVLHERLAHPNPKLLTIVDPRPLIRTAGAIQNTYTLSLLQAETLAAAVTHDTTRHQRHRGLVTRSRRADLDTVERVAVVGPSGAGKTTFSRELGRRTKLPVIHLDHHYWKPGWVTPTPEEWRALQSALLDQDRWIVDGNYRGSFDLRFSRADTVVVISLPRLRCVTRVLLRWLRHRGRELQAKGCPERFDAEFLRWVWRYPVDGRPRLDEALGRHRGQLRIIELPSTAEVAAFLASVD